MNKACRLLSESGEKACGFAEGNGREVRMIKGFNIFPYEKSKIHIRGLSRNDYSALLSLWSGVENLGMSGADAEKRLGAYLRRNPRLSFVALEKDEIIGAILGGHDGRRGILYHLAVAPKYRKMGIGHLLVEQSLAGLKKLGIQRCHAFVFPQNTKSLQFWKSLGWKERTDLVMFSYDLVDATKEEEA